MATREELAARMNELREAVQADRSNQEQRDAYKQAVQEFEAVRSREAPQAPGNGETVVQLPTVEGSSDSGL